MKGIKLREGCELSKTFANRADHYKVVEVDNVLAYVVSGGCRSSAARITPLYRADIFSKTSKMRRGKTIHQWSITSSFEHGEALNGYTFHDDYDGCTFATIAFHAIAALEERGRRKITGQAPKKANREAERAARQAARAAQLAVDKAQRKTARIEAKARGAKVHHAKVMA